MWRTLQSEGILRKLDSMGERVKVVEFRTEMARLAAVCPDLTKKQMYALPALAPHTTAHHPQYPRSIHRSRGA